jgi:hypothetical protein
MTCLTEHRPLKGLGAPEAPAAVRTRTRSRSRLLAGALRVLPWAFAFFNSVRLLSYLPTLWAIHSQGDASQHSLITWLTWAGANATMAAWLYENNGLRIDRAVAINLCNTAMCLATAALIVAYRW